MERSEELKKNIDAMEEERRKLCEVIREDETDGLYPHPEFVEAMMGFPIGWTELEPSETQ
jgi:hypothetical protein